MSWRLFVSARRVCGLAFVFALLAPAVFAGTNQDAHELLSRSFQQADLWKQGPVKLVAKVRRHTASAEPLNLEYTVYWAGPDKWRAEWNGPDGKQITIFNDGKLSNASSTPEVLWSGIELEAALAALDGGTPAGPYRLPPLPYENAKLHVSSKKINGIEARCLAFDHPKTTLCIDPASRHLLMAENGLASFAYSDYTTVGSNSYPRTVKVGSVHTSYEGDDYLWAAGGVSYPQDLKEVHVKTPIEHAELTITRGEQFPDSLFVAPENGTTVTLPSCADPASNFTAPRVDKSVKAKRPDDARKSHRYGWVRVLAIVGKDGSVQKTTMLSGDPMLGAGASDAVQRFKFTPYMRCGQAVDFQQLVVVAFPPPPPPVYTKHSVERASYPTCFPCPQN